MRSNISFVFQILLYFLFFIFLLKKRLARFVSKTHHVPFVANATTNEAWKFPFTIISDFSTDDLFTKLNNVLNISTLDLTLTGSLQHNMVSDLVNGGFEFKFNKLFAEQELKVDAGCFDNIPTFYNRAGLDVNIEANESYVRGDASIVIRNYPFDFAISVNHDITLHVENR